MSPIQFQNALLDWFDREGRKDLPWQHATNPYRVWVSEVMLQQTQVNSVIPYYQRFMARFPDVQSLATASEEVLLAHWAGLGYYARGRNLLRAAKVVVERFNGTLPNELETLCELPGIGKSTAGAILSLGSGIQATILDGNVKRVLTRFGGIQGWPQDPKIAKTLWEFAESLTPNHRVGHYNQAMMDLGATLCTRSRPACPRCPLQQECRAFDLGLTQQLPTPKPKKAIPIRQSYMLLLLDAEQGFYLEKQPPVGIWGGLWSFPQFDSASAAKAWCLQRGLGGALDFLPQRRHSFTHFKLDFTPLLLHIQQANNISENNGIWLKNTGQQALPAPVSQLINDLLQPSLF